MLCQRRWNRVDAFWVPVPSGFLLPSVVPVMFSAWLHALFPLCKPAGCRCLAAFAWGSLPLP